MAQCRKLPFRVTPVFPHNQQLEHIFRAAHGWYELGLVDDAEREIASLPIVAQLNPEVIKLRFHVARARKRPELAFNFALQLIEAEKQGMWGWLYRSQALHWQGRTLEALEGLLLVRKNWLRGFEIPYDLACYCAQLERFEEARDWFSKAVGLSKNQVAVKAMALNDPDLKPLWPEIVGGQFR